MGAGIMTGSKRPISNSSPLTRSLSISAALGGYLSLPKAMGDRTDMKSAVHPNQHLQGTGPEEERKFITYL